MTNEETRFFVHPSSYIDANVEIGDNTKIWHFSHVLENCRIGHNCSFGQNVVIGPNVIIGNRVKVQNNVSIYDGVSVEDDVFCGPSCVFTNVKNPRSEISRRDEFLSTIVRKGASIGANATIVCGHDLGRYCFVAAGATVVGEVADFALVAGTPAKQIGWMSQQGARLDETLICPIDGSRYELDGANRLSRVNKEA